MQVAEVLASASSLGAGTIESIAGLVHESAASMFPVEQMEEKRHHFLQSPQLYAKSKMSQLYA